MKNLWIIILLVVVAAGAFLLGRRNGETVSAAATPVAAPAAPALAPGEKPEHDASVPTEPVRTYRGPDGRAHIIGYDDKNPPDSSDPEQVRQALLSDMKSYPTNIQNSYNQSAEDVKAMLAGTKPIPAFMLPDPNAPKVGK